MTLNASVRRMNEEQRKTILALEAENAKLREEHEDLRAAAHTFDRAYHDAREALEKIAKAEGRFAVDQLQFATNTIEDMAALAKAALAETEPKRTEAAGG